MSSRQGRNPRQFHGNLQRVGPWAEIRPRDSLSKLSPRSTALTAFGNPGFHPFYNLAQGRVQRVRDLPQAADRRIDNAALDAADVGSVEAAFGAERLLRLACLLPELAQHDADRLLFERDRWMCRFGRCGGKFDGAIVAHISQRHIRLICLRLGCTGGFDVLE